jgi:hypothetical protein
MQIFVVLKQVARKYVTDYPSYGAQAVTLDYYF